MFFCSCSSYLQQVISCSNLQESGLPHELWNQNKCVSAAVQPTCSTQEPCAARNKLQWAARSSIVLWTLKSEKRIFAAFQATSSSKQPCAACNKLQRAAGLGREIWNRKNVFLHPFKLPAAHKSLVQPPTSYSELQEAGLLHEHGYWKNDFFGSCSSYCSSQQPCAAGNKLQWAAGSWIGSWALKWEKCSLPAVLSICSSQQPRAAGTKLQWAAGTSIASWALNGKMYFASFQSTCSSQQPCAVHNKLLWAAGSWIASWALKSETCVFAAFQATCNSQQPCAAGNRLQWAAGSWIAKWILKSEKCIFAAVQSTWSSQKPCAAGNKLQWAAGVWIASWAHNSLVQLATSYRAARSLIASWASKSEKCILQPFKLPAARNSLVQLIKDHNGLQN